jgi:hypothetical protein
MRLDVATANNIAQAAARSALDVAQDNLSLVVDPIQRREITSAIQGLFRLELLRRTFSSSIVVLRAWTLGSTSGEAIRQCRNSQLALNVRSQGEVRPQI